MAEFAWLFMPLAVAAGASIVTGFLMHARAEVDSARQRQALVEARALLGAAQRILEDRVEAAEAAARREALDEFLADVRDRGTPYPARTVAIRHRAGAGLFPRHTAHALVRARSARNPAAPVRSTVVEVLEPAGRASVCWSEFHLPGNQHPPP